MHEQQVKIRNLIDDGLILMQLEEALKTAKRFSVSYVNFSQDGDSTHFLSNNSQLVGDILCDVVRKSLNSVAEPRKLESLFLNRDPSVILLILEVRERIQNINTQLIALGAPPFNPEEPEQVEIKDDDDLPF